LQWSEKMVGLSLAVVGLLVGLVQAGLTRVVNPRLGNEKSTYLGLALYGLGLVLMAFATETWMMFAFLVPYCLGGIAGPALQSSIAGLVQPSEQGALQVALTSVISLTAIVGPLLMNNLFFYFSKPTAPVFFPGAHFLLGGLLMVISIWITYRVFKRQTPHKDIASVAENTEDAPLLMGH